MSINNRWFQLGASLIAMIMIANLQYAWTLFVQPLQDATGWKLSDIQFAFTLFILFQTWVQPLDGWLIDRLGPRGFISAAGVLCGLGWAGMGYATSLPQLYVLYCLAGTGAAFVYSGSIGSALKWFKDRRGLASGIMAAGFGGGTALFIPFISSMLASSGHRATFVATGVLQGLVILIVAQFLRHPAAEAASAKPTAGAAAQQLGKRQFTTLEMLRTPQFYVLYISFVLMATGGLLVTANAGPMARSWGLSAAALTLAATLSPLANGASRIFWGWASDRLGRENTMIVAFLLQAVFLYLVVAIGQQSAALVRLHAGDGLLHLGRDLLAVSGHLRGLLRHPPRHVELRGAVHGEGHGRDHGRLGRRAAVRAVRQLGGGLLQQRRDGARRGRHRLRVAERAPGRACARSLDARRGPRQVVRTWGPASAGPGRMHNSLADELQQARATRRADVVAAVGARRRVRSRCRLRRGARAVAAAAGRRATRSSAAKSATPTRRCGAR